MHQVDIEPTVGIENNINIRSREKIRVELESWLMNTILENEKEILREIANIPNISEYTENNETLKIKPYFVLKSKSSIEHIVIPENLLDPDLYKDGWVTEDEFNRLDQRLRSALNRTADKFTEETYEHQIVLSV